MQRAGLHEDTDVPPLPAGSRLAGVDTVVGLVDGYEQVGVLLAELNARLAVLVRDGGLDALPSASALAVMSAVGGVHHEVTVAASLGFTQIEVTSAHLDDAVPSAGQWVQRHTGMSKGAVAELRRVGRTFERYPMLAGAFLEGRLRSAELVEIDKIIPKRFHGPALDEAIEMLGDVQGELIVGAEAAPTLREFSKFCKQVQDCVDTDGPEPKTPGSDDSTIRLRQRADGRWELFGDLNASDGAILATGVEERDQKNLRARKDNPETKGVRDDRVPEARHAACLIELVTAGAASGKPGRVGLYLHMDLCDLVSMGGEPPTPTATTMANYDITSDTLWALLADADVTPIFTESGTPLCYGRTQRLAPHMLRMALAFRDDTCWVPGCDAGPARHDNHHLERWRDGGTTDPFNLTGGCSLHHHLVHDHGWNVIPPPDGQPGDAILIKPDGTIFDPMPRWRKKRQAPTDHLATRRLNALRDELPNNLRNAG